MAKIFYSTHIQKTITVKFFIFTLNVRVVIVIQSLFKSSNHFDLKHQFHFHLSRLDAPYIKMSPDVLSQITISTY